MVYITYVLCGVQKIISGGQVGADRAGLDFAIERGIAHGGHCPRGRLAQDGQVPAKYQLSEAERPGYPYRTKLNVRNSDATVIFTGEPPGRGSALTISSCLALGKQYLVLRPDQANAVVQLKAFLERHAPKVLNVAGSRGQEFYDLAFDTLGKVYDLCQTHPTRAQKSMLS